MSAKDSQIKEFRDSLVQFKDPVYGYISIPKSYVLELIDNLYATLKRHWTVGYQTNIFSSES